MGVGEHLLPVPPDGKLTPASTPISLSSRNLHVQMLCPLVKSVLVPRAALRIFFQGTKLAGKR